MVINSNMDYRSITSASWRHEEDLMKKYNMTEELLDLIPDPFNNIEVQGTCMGSIHDIGQNYKLIHGYIALFICVFGTIANILNLIVLKKMASPINRMLTALAFADMLVMLEYIPFAIHMYIIPTLNFSYPWALFVLFHSHFTQVFHTISIQLTLTMAIWRYVAIRCANPSTSYCTFKRCNWCILASYICPFFLCIPNYLTFAIHHKQIFFFDTPYDTILTNKHGSEKIAFLKLCEIFKDFNCTKTIHQVDKYVVDLSEMAKAHDGLLHGIHFWTFSVFIKLIPCVVLTIFMCWLLNTLYKAKRRHALLQQNKDGQNKIKNPPTITNDEHTEHEQNQILVIIRKDDYNNITTMNGNNIKHTTTTTTNCSNGKIHDDQISNIPSCGGGGSIVGNNERRHTKVGFHLFPTILKKNNNSQKIKNIKRSDRTSKMLVAVLCLFLLTEFPQGIMAFLSGFYGQEFFRYCYSTSAEIWDILALFNSAVNFVLYCFMSKQFRLQFQQLFKLHSPKCIPNCNTIISTTV